MRSTEDEKNSQQAVERQITTQCDPKNFIEDDLFGYMDTSKNVRRTAPAKTNGMIALFDYTGDLNRGVRYDPTGEEHSLYDIEIVTNVFRSNWALELDRVGLRTDQKEGEDFNLDANEREKRVKAFLGAIFHLWSRVKQTNLLSSMGPEVLVMILRDDKTLAIGDKLTIDRQYRLNTDSLLDALRLHESRIKESYIGYSLSFLRNIEQVTGLTKDFPNLNVMRLPELRDRVLSDDFRIYT
jgi:CRISPR-associated protein Cst2